MASCGGPLARCALALMGVACATLANAQPDVTGAASEAEVSIPADTPRPISDSVDQVTNWVIGSGDNKGLPFIVIDKVAAVVFVYDAGGEFLAASPALFGETPGDESSPGVGDRELSEITPEERTTPAGRFVAKFGPASGNRQVLWVDYETSISLHAVVTTKKRERRLERLESPTPEDNRITYGCINVPTAFYTDVVSPLFTDAGGIVYILPETRSLNQVFLGVGGAGPFEVLNDPVTTATADSDGDTNSSLEPAATQ